MDFFLYLITLVMFKSRIALSVTSTAALTKHSLNGWQYGTTLSYSSSICNGSMFQLQIAQTGLVQRVSIDNHDSGYLGMAVQLYVQAHLGHYHILTQKEYSQKLMAQLKSTPHFTYICII